MQQAQVVVSEQHEEQTPGKEPLLAGKNVNSGHPKCATGPAQTNSLEGNKRKIRRFSSTSDHPQDSWTLVRLKAWYKCSEATFITYLLDNGLTLHSKFD